MVPSLPDMEVPTDTAEFYRVTGKLMSLLELSGTQDVALLTLLKLMLRKMENETSRREENESELAQVVRDTEWVGEVEDKVSQMIELEEDIRDGSDTLRNVVRHTDDAYRKAESAENEVSELQNTVGDVQSTVEKLEEDLQDLRRELRTLTRLESAVESLTTRMGGVELGSQQ
jgi:chromosome segregation ATPase